MRQIGVLPDEQDAQRFSDYLLTEGVSSRVDAEPEGWSVWILNEEQVASSREAFQDFLADPSAAKYRTVTKQADRTRREVKRQQKEYEKNLVDVRNRWAAPTIGRCPVTLGLIVVSIALSFGSNFGDNFSVTKWLYIAELEPVGKDMVQWDGLTAIYEKGQVWRLVTPIFVHVGGPIHLLFNMYWTYQFGLLIESRRGPWRHLGLVLFIAIASNLAQYAWDNPLFGGMSGVGYGQFGYLWMKSKFDPAAAMHLPPRLVTFFLIWLVVCMTGLLGPVANTAHLVGMLAGISVGYAPVLLRRFR